MRCNEKYFIFATFYLLERDINRTGLLKYLPLLGGYFKWT